MSLSKNRNTAGVRGGGREAVHFMRAGRRWGAMNCDVHLWHRGGRVAYDPTVDEQPTDSICGTTVSSSNVLPLGTSFSAFAGTAMLSCTGSGHHSAHSHSPPYTSQLPLRLPLLSFSLRFLLNAKRDAWSERTCRTDTMSNTTFTTSLC